MDDPLFDEPGRHPGITLAFEQLELNAMSVARLLARGRGGDALEHARRVSRLAVDLALVLEIPEPHVSDIERAALLHEVEQPVLYAVMRDVPFLASAAAIAAAARALAMGMLARSGTDVRAMGAAIVAVADAYDELAADPAAPVGQAIDMLEQQDEAALDPVVLRALRALKDPRWSSTVIGLDGYRDRSRFTAEADRRAA